VGRCGKSRLVATSAGWMNGQMEQGVGAAYVFDLHQD